jgi:hypothetical protein
MFSAEISRTIQGCGEWVTLFGSSYERLRVHKLFLRLLRVLVVADDDAKVLVPIFRAQRRHRAQRHLVQLK